MCKLIAYAPAVTIYAAVAAPAVYVHPVMPAAAGQYSFCVHKMHLVSFLPLNKPEMVFAVFALVADAADLISVILISVLNDL